MAYVLDQGFIIQDNVDIGKVVQKPDGKYIAVIWPLGRIRYTADTPEEAFEEVVAQLEGFENRQELLDDKAAKKAASVQKGLETKRKRKEVECSNE